MKMDNKGIPAFFLIFLLVLTGCAGVGEKGQPANLSPTFSTTYPREAEDMYRQAEEAYRAGKVPNAISLWERISQKYPSTAVAAKSLNRIGEIHLEQGQPELAARYFDYLVYAYPSWDGIPSAKLNQLKLLEQTGKKKQAMKEAVSLWELAANNPEVRFALAELMLGIYSSENDIETAFDWSTSGFSVANTPEQKKSLTALTKETLGRADEALVKKLYKRNPSDFMKVFLDFRYAEIEVQKGQGETSREQLRAILARNPGHPLALEIQAAIRGSKVVETGIPLNPDKIGVLVPLNGPNAKYGDMVTRGIGLAISDWNQGHPGQEVTLVMKDAGSEPDTAARSFKELVRKEGVLAVVGPLGTQANKTVVPLANRDGVPLLTLTQKEEDDTDNSFVLHVFIDSRDLVKTLVRYCREKLKYERFACLFPDDRYGQKLSKIFAETVQEQGGTMMASASYKEKSTDFTEPLQKLMNIAKKNSPMSATEGTPFDALFIPDQVGVVSLIAPQLPYNNVVGVTLLGTNLWSEAPLVQAGGVYVDQALFATSFFPESRNPKVRTFSEKFASLYNSQPSYLEAQAYDALMMLLQARSKSPEKANRNSVFQNLLQSQGFQGVAGNYTVNSRGDLDRQYTILQVVNGSLNQVYP
ncbi:MAG TPA: ABC transporter substrate-binding protein [Deltaproteobacteria bacterium]|nr:ABC transporter substrate-binding protein [Deltaproteobacteria bacterium]